MTTIELKDGDLYICDGNITGMGYCIREWSKSSLRDSKIIAVYHSQTEAADALEKISAAQKSNLAKVNI